MVTTHQQHVNNTMTTHQQHVNKTSTMFMFIFSSEIQKDQIKIKIKEIHQSNISMSTKQEGKWRQWTIL